MTTQILTIKSLQEVASVKLPQSYRDFYNDGAMDMITVRDNESAYDQYKIVPRILRNVEQVDTTTEIFGAPVPFPLGFSPAAMHCLAHPDGEKATSKAAAAYGIPMALSVWATTSLEEVAACGQGNPYIMQITLFKERSSALAIIRRAEQAGYKALFVTVDTPTLGRRLNEIRNKIQLPDHLTYPNMIPKDDLLEANKETQRDGMETSNTKSGFRTFYHATRDPSNTWESVIPWLKSQTKMEIWLKGEREYKTTSLPTPESPMGVITNLMEVVYHPDDAMLAVKHRISGIVISNHGGRQLDGVPATLDLLPAIAQAVKGRIPLAIDGGIRRGSDIFKALALGANFCFIARPVLWGLANDGEKGVKMATEILLQEFKSTMMLAGCASVRDITRDYLLKASGTTLARL